MTRERATWRWRLTAVCALLGGLAMTQSAGLLVPDTKLDLAIAPLDFLARAAELWDGRGAFGQLQNQAYGYLWPMGPVFAVGHLLDLPGWVVQRLWMALVLCVAFLGTARLARTLGVRSDLACVLGGLAYALSPRMLTVIGPSSVEVWPMALAPWVLLPLVVGAQHGSPRRAAALSALAIAMVGGVNAAAASAVLPLGALWLLTRSPGARRRTMLAWWPVFTLLATLWWLVPLFLLGRYSPPFLDFIESAGFTTIPTDLADVLRGTSNWVPYVDATSRAGNDLLRQFYLPVNSAFVIAAGVLGLCLARTRDRLFLVSGVATGLFLVSMGHVGAAQGWLAPTIQPLLDGALAPLRNIHKFDPVLRLPLVLGLAWLVDWLVEMARDPQESRADRVNFRVLSGIVAFSVLAAALPAAAGRLTPAGGFQAVPDYWSEAADWLADDQDTGVALLAPGSMFGAYVWGAARDEPFQSLASTSWAVRNAVPLAPAGNIRMLDAIEDSFAQGHGSAALTAYLRRSGITHVVVRNDLVRSDDHPDPVLVHQALDESPGIELAATFGPAVGGDAHIDGELGRALINGGWQNDYDAVEIYALDGPAEAGTGTDVAPVVVGGPEDLLDLTELGVLDGVPTRLAADIGDDLAEAGADGAPVVLTDGYRSVVRHFGRIHDATSPVRTRAEAVAQPTAVRDYELPDAERWSTFAEYRGIEDVRASSSLSDVGASPASPGRMPFAALDGDPTTSWQSARFSDADGHWWEVELTDDAVPDQVVVTGALVGDQEVVVSTNDWESEQIVLAPDTPVVVDVGDRTSDHLRISDTSGRTSTPLSLSAVELSGIVPERVLALPDLPTGVGAPDAIVLRALSDSRTGCVAVDLDVRCVQGRAAAPEEPTQMPRRIVLPEAATYDVSVLARGRPGEALDALVQADSLVEIKASSAGVPDSRASVVAAVDGNPSTTWSAELSDVRPSLDLRWLRPRTISSIELRVDADTAARAPQSLELRWRGGKRTVALDEDGRATFRPIRTDALTIEVAEAEPATSLDFAGQPSDVPVGISELSLGDGAGLPLRLDDAAVDLGCGSGPDLVTNDVRLRTAVTASPRDLFEGELVPATPCGVAAVSLRAGDNRLSARASEAFAPSSVVLDHGQLPIGEATSLAGSSDGVGSQRLAPAPGNSVIAGFANVNPGWVARQDDTELAPVTVDGWRQGWTVSSDTAPVEASFAPGPSYRWSLAAGALAVLLLLLYVLVSRRRRDSVTGPPSLDERSAPVVPLLVAVPFLGGLLAGVPGVVAAVLALVAVGAFQQVSRPTARALVAALVVPAIGAYAFFPWGGLDTWAGDLAWPSYVVVVVVSGLVVLLAADSPARSRRRTRSTGISTSR